MDKRRNHKGNYKHFKQKWKHNTSKKIFFQHIKILRGKFPFSFPATLCGMEDLSSGTRDQTHAPFSGSTVS